MLAIILLFALVTAFWAAFQLQLVTLIPALSLRSVHKSEGKRWALRLISLGLMAWATTRFALSGGAIATLVICGGLLAISFFNDNTARFRALNPENLLHVAPGGVPPDTVVVGINMPDGTAVCYPLNDMVIPRHLVNDTISDVPRLVSYCAACHSCMVYDPVVNGQRLTFQVVAVKRRNMIMRDRQTGTLWQQGTGEAIYGAFKGTQLTFLDAQQMSPGDWIALYPETLVAQAKPDAPKGRLSRKALGRMLRITNVLMAPGETDIGTELPLREAIFGLSLNGQDKAYPVSELRLQPEFDDRVGDEAVTIRYDPKSGAINAVSQETNAGLVMQSHWWFGWKEFHPDTQIWRANG